MDVAYLRFVLLDSKYKIRLLQNDDAARGMACWKGYLFYAGGLSVQVIRMDEHVLNGSVEPVPLNKIHQEGIIGLIVHNNTLCYYTKDILYSIGCEAFIQGENGAVPTKFYHGDIQKVTDNFVLSSDGNVYERVGFELVVAGAVDICGEYVLSDELYHKNRKLDVKIDIEESKAQSLNVLKDGLFAIGYYKDPDHTLAIYDKSKQLVNFGNLTSAFGDPSGYYQVSYFSGFGSSISELIVVSHSLSIQLSLAGRIEGSNWTVLELSSDEYIAEMPMSEDALTDILPTFMNMDYWNTHRLKVPDDRVEVLEYPPYPTVCVLTSDGRLIPFQLVNTNHLDILTCMEPLSRDFVEKSSPSIKPGFLASPVSSLSTVSSEKADTQPKAEALREKEEKGAGGFFAQGKDFKELSPMRSTLDQFQELKVQETPLFKTTPERKVVDKEITQDFTPKQNTIMKAFVDIHNVHINNISNIRETLSELNSLVGTLQSASKIKSCVRSAEDKIDERYARQDALNRTMQSLHFLKERLENMRESINVNNEVSRAIIQHRDELEAGIERTAAYYDYCRSLSKLSLEDDHDRNRTKKVLQEAALEQVRSCADLLNSCLEVKQDVRHEGPIKRQVDLRKILGRRRVELRDVDLSSSTRLETVSKKEQPKLAHMFSLPSLSPLARSIIQPTPENATPPSIPSSSLAQKSEKSPMPADTSKAFSIPQSVMSKLDSKSPSAKPEFTGFKEMGKTGPIETPKTSFISTEPKAKESTPSPKPEIAPPFSFSGQIGKTEEKKPIASSDKPAPFAPLVPSPLSKPDKTLPKIVFSPPSEQPAGTVEKPKKEDEPKVEIPAFSSLSFGAPVKPPEASKQSNIFAFSAPPIKADQEKTSTETDIKMESPEGSLLATPTRQIPPPQMSFGHTAAFAPVVPTFSTPSSTSGGFAAFANAPTGFASFAPTQQPAFGQSIAPTQDTNREEKPKPKLPPAFTQFRG